MAEEYKGRQWKEWQSRWDVMPEDQRRIINFWAKLNYTTDPQFTLRLVADIHTGSKTVQSIQGDIDTNIDKQFNLYKNDFKIWSKGTGYDKEYWGANDSAKLKEIFKEQLLLRPGRPDIATSNVERIVENDTTVKQGEGSLSKEGVRNVEGWEFDADTGKATAIEDGPAGPGPGSKWFDRLVDNGWDPDDKKTVEFADYLDDIQREDNLKDYEVSKIIATDPETIRIEYDTARAELDPKLAELHAEELASIETWAEKAEVTTEKFFREDIAPTIRKEVGLLGGRDRAYQSEVLAKSAAELSEARESTVGMMTLQAEFAEQDRQRSLAMRDLSKAESITAFGGEQGLKAYEGILKAKMKTLETMQTLSMQKSNLLTMRASERYMRDYQKEIKRLEDIQTSKARSAQQRAGKLGMYANVFQGMASGLLASGFNPLAMVAGGAIGYATGRIQQQQYAMGGASIQSPDYWRMGQYWRRDEGKSMFDWGQYGRD